MCWLRVYAWLRVKLKVKGTGVRSVLSWKLYHRTRQFVMSWLRVYAWLRVKIKVKGTGVRIVLWCAAGSLNEAICYVLATRLRVATRQT